MMDKIKSTIGRSKALFILCLSLLSLLMFSGSLKAEEKSVIESIRAIPFSQARALSVQATPSSEEADNAKVNQVAKRLREVLNNIGKDSQQRSSSTASVARSKKNSATSESVPSIKKIWYHPISKTPRQIRFDLSNAKARSASDKKEAKETARELLRSLKSTLRIDNPDDELKLYLEESDLINRQHLRFYQQYKDLSLWPGELVVHLNPDGNVDKIAGTTVPTPQKIVTNPVLNAEDAILKARARVPDGQDGTSSEPELIIYAPGDRLPRLAWKMELSVSPMSDWLVVVDALNGIILTAYNQVKTENVTATATDIFGNRRTVNVWQRYGTYYMVDTSKPMYNSASNPPNPDSTEGAIIIMDAQNEPATSNVEYIPPLAYVTSGSASSGWLTDAVSAAYNLSKIYDYYRERHNRNSIDNNGCSIMAVVRLGRNFENAFWYSGANSLFFGDAESFAGALDIVAHEYAHGVTQYEAGLMYKDQSGALNEAFSDIFGEAVEAYSLGKADWSNGSQVEEIRSMKNPSSLEIGNTGRYYPSNMSEFIEPTDSFLRQFTDQDYGGVHINMTIVAHAFYLLAEGLDNAIGIQDAEKIFYRALSYHLVKNSQFIDSRLACIASAEELFGENSAQALKTAEAYDAVEIFDDAETPDTVSSAPAVSGPDAVLALRYAYTVSGGEAYFLFRREQSDPNEGVLLSFYDVENARPSVSGDGSVAVFVDSINDLCFIETDGYSSEECLGFPGLVHSVSMSPDGNHFAFVFQDENGEPEDSITVINFLSDDETEEQTFQLTAPIIDGISKISVEYADAMDFTADGKYIIYDAFNEVQFTDGSKTGAWSIYAIDLETEQVFAVIPPISGLEIGNPNLSQTSDNFMTFDAYQVSIGSSLIFALNMNNGNKEIIGQVTGNFGVPCYTGDDTGIVYSQADSSVQTGTSLLYQAIEDDHITPTGSPSLFFEDATSGVIYRRGTYTEREGDISVSQNALTFDNVLAGYTSSTDLTVSNVGNANLIINGFSVTGKNSSEFQIQTGCRGQTLLPTGSCNVSVLFSPTSTGTKSAALVIESDDPDNADVEISLTGNSVSSSSDAQIAFSHSSISFGDVLTGGSASSELTIYNVGTSNLTIDGFDIDGEDDSEFQFQTNCWGQTLYASESCTVSVSFSPASTGTKSAYLVIESDDPDNAFVDIPLTGTGYYSNGTTDDDDGGGGCFMNTVMGH